MRFAIFPTLFCSTERLRGRDGRNRVRNQQSYIQLRRSKALLVGTTDRGRSSGGTPPGNSMCSGEQS